MRPSTTDYSGRQVDAEILQTIVKPTGVTQLALSMTSTPPKVVAGAQKMIQRYVVTLLTRLEDVHFDQTFGTDFWARLLMGAAQNSGQVAQAVAYANLTVVSELQAEDANTVYGAIPLDEQLEDATLDDFQVDRQAGALYLTILLTNKAGDTYTYVLPLTVGRSGA